MTEELKQLIEHAETRLTGKAKIIMLVPTGEYNGFWGHNGYQNITVLWTDRSTDPDTGDYKWYIGGYGHDVFEISQQLNDKLTILSIDFDNRYLVPRIFFASDIDITFDNGLLLSAFNAHVERKWYDNV